MKKTLLIALGLCLSALPLVRLQLVAKEPPKEPPKGQPLVAQVVNPDLKASESSTTEKNTDKPNGPTVSPYLNLLLEDPESRNKIPEGGTIIMPNEARDKAAKKMVEEARKAYEANLQAYEAGNVTLEGVYNWSSRWMGAAKGDNFDRVKEMAAVDAHLERMRKLRERVKALHDAAVGGGETDKLAAVDFFIAEAERMKANLAARPAPAMISAGAPPVDARVLSDKVARHPEQLGVQKPPTENAIATPPGLERTISGHLPPLRYDGKTFGDWSTILTTDLSPDKRTEAIKAMAAFGANGEGPQAAELIIGVMRGYSVWTIDGSSEGELKQAALDAFRKIPRGEALKPLTEALQHGNANQRLFALWVLPTAMVEPKESAPLFVEAMKDKDAHVRSRARWLVAAFAHDSPSLVPSLRAALATPDRNEVISAFNIIGGIGAALFADGRPPVKMPPTPELIPELVAFLGHADLELRGKAAEALVYIGRPAEHALIQATQSKDAEVSKLAQETLDRIDSLEKTKAANSRR
jgi:hypothetical protein